MLDIKNSGFTLIELLIVIVILSLLSAILLPRLANLQTDARISVIKGIAGTMKSTARLIQSKAFITGLSRLPGNPGNQSALIVTTNIGSAEVDWRNLCPESRAELADQLTMVDYIDLTVSSGITSMINNRYTLVGYDIPGFSVPTNSGCYVIYDSFGDPDCTVTPVIVDC